MKAISGRSGYNFTQRRSMRLNYKWKDLRKEVFPFINNFNYVPPFTAFNYRGLFTG